MNCREAERLIDTFYDGELDGRSMRDAALHITRCKRCEAELNERERVQKLLSSAIEEQIADIDLSRIWAAVEPTLTPAAGNVRRLGWPDGPSIAATSAKVGGLLLGRHGSPDMIDPETDTGEWRTTPAPGRRWSWSVAGGVALAASVLLAIALVPGERGGLTSDEIQAGLRDGQQQVASESAARPASAPQMVAQRPAQTGGGVPFDLVRADVGRPRAANKQVQVESVNFPRSSVAMWSEPATDTTVIWIEDEEQLAASGRR